MGAFLRPCVLDHISRFVFSRHVAKKPPRGQLAVWNDHQPVGAGPLHYCDGGFAWGGQEGWSRLVESRGGVCFGLLGDVWVCHLD